MEQGGLLLKMQDLLSELTGPSERCFKHGGFVIPFSRSSVAT